MLHAFDIVFNAMPIIFNLLDGFSSNFISLSVNN